MTVTVSIVLTLTSRSLTSRITGYSTAKIGKYAAFLIGGSIIMLQVANEQGWVKVDWNKVTRGIDQVGDRVETAVTGEGPKWMDKVSRVCQ